MVLLTANFFSGLYNRSCFSCLRLTIIKTKNPRLAAVHATGYNSVKILNCSSAKIPSACLPAAICQVNSVSECGLFQDFLTVGPNPRTSVRTTRMTDQRG